MVSNVVRIKALIKCVIDVLTTFCRLLWSVTEQTHDNMESSCLIDDLIKKQKKIPTDFMYVSVLQ